MIGMLLIFTFLICKLMRYISRHFLGTHEKRVTRGELWLMGTIIPALKIPLPFKRKIKGKH